MKEVNAGFKLPENNLISVQGLFCDCTSLESLPDSFVLPQSVQYAYWMFNNCRSLRTLPKGFTIPENVKTANNMFLNCASLESLPEGFGFAYPQIVTSVDNMFSGCSKLTSLPASLKLTGLTGVGDTINTMFKLPDDQYKASPLKTYYAGNAEDMLNANYWATQNRELVTTVPDDKALVTLYVPNDALDGFEVWTTRLVDNGSKLEVPSAPIRATSAFVGWFTESDCKTAFDFTQSLTGNVKLYAKYRANNGELPTVSGNNKATWAFLNGTLTISCEPGETIDDLGLLNNDAEPGYWNFLRDQVSAVVLEDSVKTVSMAGWFRNMPNLADVSHVFVPAGTKSVQYLFDACPKLSTLPDGFALPEGVENVVGMFRGCTSLESLPSGFNLPKGVQNASGFIAYAPITTLPAGFTIPEGMVDASWMFFQCKNLTTLPDGFNIPGSVKTVSQMFSECSLTSLPSSFLLKEGLEDVSYLFFSNKQLKTLPAGFTMPASVLNAQEAFNKCESLESLPEGFTFKGTTTKVCWTFSECSSLRALPEGFKLPSSPTSIQSMFANCHSLHYLPASFDLSVLPAELRTDANMFDLFYREPASALATVYYGGTDLSKLSPEGSDAVTYWKDKYRRTLVNDPASLDQGTLLVEFKTKATGGSDWTTQKTLLTDTEGKVTEPQPDARFGYSFSGWCTDEGCNIAAVFSESLSSLDTDGDGVVTLYGTYTLEISVDVPLAAKVEVDSSGNVTPAVFKMRSNTPVALSIASVSSEAASGAEKLFPNADERKKVQVQVKMNGAVTSLVFGESKGPLSSLSAATASSPTTVDTEIGLDRNNAQLNFQPGEDITSFAKLTWTIVPE